jgi:hypothetical protein
LLPAKISATAVASIAPVIFAFVIVAISLTVVLRAEVTTAPGAKSKPSGQPIGSIDHNTVSRADWMLK